MKRYIRVITIFAATLIALSVYSAVADPFRLWLFVVVAVVAAAVGAALGGYLERRSAPKATSS